MGLSRLTRLTCLTSTQLREFGVLGAVGMIMLFALTFGPSMAWLVVLFGGKIDNKDSQLPSSWGESWAVRMRKAYEPLLILVFFVVVIVLAGISQVRTDVRASEFLNRQSPTRQMPPLLESLSMKRASCLSET